MTTNNPQIPTARPSYGLVMDLDALIDSIEGLADQCTTSIEKNTELLNDISNVYGDALSNDTIIDTLNAKSDHNLDMIQQLNLLNLRSEFFQAQLHILELHSDINHNRKQHGLNPLNEWKDDDLNWRTCETTLDNLFLEFEYLKTQKLSFRGIPSTFEYIQESRNQVNVSSHMANQTLEFNDDSYLRPIHVGKQRNLSNHKNIQNGYNFHRRHSSLPHSPSLDESSKPLRHYTSFETALKSMNSRLGNSENNTIFQEKLHSFDMSVMSHAHSTSIFDSITESTQVSDIDDEHNPHKIFFGDVLTKCPSNITALETPPRHVPSNHSSTAMALKKQTMVWLNQFQQSNTTDSQQTPNWAPNVNACISSSSNTRNLLSSLISKESTKFNTGSSSHSQPDFQIDKTQISRKPSISQLVSSSQEASQWSLLLDKFRKKSTSQPSGLESRDPTNRQKDYKTEIEKSKPIPVPGSLSRYRSASLGQSSSSTITIGPNHKMIVRHGALSGLNQHTYYDRRRNVSSNSSTIAPIASPDNRRVVSTYVRQDHLEDALKTSLTNVT